MTIVNYDTPSSLFVDIILLSPYVKGVKKRS